MARSKPPADDWGLRFGDVRIRSRGRLPHWEAENSIYFFTFRLGDSLPAHVLDGLRKERKRLESEANTKHGRITPSDAKEIAYAVSAKADEYLDRGYGACHLRDPRVAQVVKDALRFSEGLRYRMHGWCIMPNHVHLVFLMLPGNSLEGIAHSLKSFTAHEVNRMLGRKGAFWQREYFDHLIRSDEEYGRLMSYVLNNPAAAGLEDWPWVGLNRPE